MKQVIFTLTTARTGTLYLEHFFRRNVRACVCRHEPFFDWGNPTLFGRAIYDAHAGRVDRIRQLLERKRRYLERWPGRAYLETSHAFLKSAYLVALEVFPDLRLIHLIRDPLKVARSAAYREAWRRRVHAPFHFYRGEDGRRHFVWALTGNEEIFQAFPPGQLNLFQWYLVEWIELENRAMRYLAEHGLAERCFTLHSPADLNDAAKMTDLIGFLGLERSQPTLDFGGRKNRSLGYSSALAAAEEKDCAEVLARLPPQYLQIFQRPPYTQFAWSRRLTRAADSAPEPRSRVRSCPEDERLRNCARI